MVAVSGITPSGRLTLGNYLGALRRFASGDAAETGFWFVADLHAMTTRHDPARLRALTRETALLLLASGLPAGQRVRAVRGAGPRPAGLPAGVHGVRR